MSGTLDRLLRLFAVGVALVLASLAVVAAPAKRQRDIEDLPPLVMNELKTEAVNCPEDIGAGWICGRFKGSFSRLKFELEVELDLKDFEARPLEGWKLADGRYRRSWAVRGYAVTMIFENATSIVMISQGPLEEVDPPEPEVPPSADPPADPAPDLPEDPPPEPPPGLPTDPPTEPPTEPPPMEGARDDI